MPIVPPHPSAKILASTSVLSDSMNVTILGESYKWNQTVFVCTDCILECNTNVNLISIHKKFQDCFMCKKCLVHILEQAQ